MQEPAKAVIVLAFGGIGMPSSFWGLNNVDYQMARNVSCQGMTSHTSLISWIFYGMGGAILKPKISKWASKAKAVFSLCVSITAKLVQSV